MPDPEHAEQWKEQTWSKETGNLHVVKINRPRQLTGQGSGMVDTANEDLCEHGVQGSETVKHPQADEGILVTEVAAIIQWMDKESEEKICSSEIWHLAV